MHYHVGSNMPGYLPDNEPACFDSAKVAVELLRHELKDLRDSYYESCKEGAPDWCECGWCDAAVSVQVAISRIAIGDAIRLLRRKSAISFYFSPPEGADEVHWVECIPTPKNECELSDMCE